MSDQIVLSWTVDVANSSFGPSQAATALAAVPLYLDPTTDPVLGQFFGLTVANDSTTNDSTSATRTLTLNMDAANKPMAPPPFPCHPITSTPPLLPYPLRSTKTLAGNFFVTNGSSTVTTSDSQLPSLVSGDVVQFLSQEGVFYVVSGPPSSSSITLLNPFTGTTGNTTAFKEVKAPVTLAAFYSTSPLDTDGFGSLVSAGPGARTVTLTYKDSTGSSFSTTTSLTGRRPAAVTLAGGSVDIAEIENIVIKTTGSFKNSVGEITLSELSSPIPAVPATATTFDFLGKLTDEAQLLLKLALAYLPPSYFALAGQQSSELQLAGDFFLTTGSKNVPTSADQSSVLTAGDVLRFAAENSDNFQLDINVFYVVASVTPKLVILTEGYRGVDDNFTGSFNVNSNIGTKGNLGSKVLNKASAAVKVGAAAPPSDTQLAGPFLSNLFTRTLQLALAGVPVVPQTITFA